MAEFIASAQTLAAGDVVAFNGSTKRCANVVHRDGSGTFTLRGSKNCCNPAKYIVHVHAVITAAAATTTYQLQLNVGGEPIKSSLISVVSAASGNVLTGNAAIMVDSCFCCEKLTLRAVTAVPLTSADIIIERVA